MAAHPFGPIEKHLLRVYHKRGFHPHALRPRFCFETNLRVPSIDTQPIWTFSSHPKVTISEPAINKNSNRHWKLKLGDLDLDLLSRGLGYRITFTMPADKENKDSELESRFLVAQEIAVLDYFGENVFAVIPLKQLKAEFRLSTFSGELEFERFVREANELVLESTISHFKVVIGQKQEYVFPLSWSEESPISDELRVALRALWPVLKETNAFVNLETDSSKQLVASLQYLVTYLSTNSSAMPHTKKVAVKDHLLHMLAVVLERCEGLGEEATPAYTLQSIKQDVEAWVSREAPFPVYLDSAFVSRVLSLTPHHEQLEADETVSSPVTCLALNSVLSRKLLESLSKLKKSILDHEEQSDIRWTKGFGVFCTETGIKFSTRTDLENRVQRSFFVGANMGQWFVVHERDLVVLVSDGNLFVVDLVLTQARQLQSAAKPNVSAAETAFLQTWAEIVHQVTVLNQGLFIFSQTWYEDSEIVFQHYSTCIPDASVDSYSLVKVAAGGSDGTGQLHKFAAVDAKCQMPIGIVFQKLSNSRNENKLMLSCAALKYNAVTNGLDTLTRSAVDLEVESVRGNEMLFWTTDKEGRSFLCFVAPSVGSSTTNSVDKAKILVMVHHKHRFVCLGASGQQNTRWFQLKSHWDQLETVSHRYSAAKILVQRLSSNTEDETLSLQLRKLCFT